MRHLLLILSLIPALLNAQQIQYSDPLKDNSNNINFDIIGKFSKNIVVLKKNSWRYDLNVFNDSMQLQETIDLDFLPSRTLHVDYAAFPNHFFLVYHFQKKGVVYCMSAKFDGNGKRLGDPVELDTTHVKGFGDNKIYSLIRSENKKRLMVFRIQKEEHELLFGTCLFDQDMNLIRRSKLSMEFDPRRDVFNDFLLDNDGHLVFFGTHNESRRNYSNLIFLIRKPADRDVFLTKKIQIDSAYVTDLLCKVDNINKRYLITSLYATERGGDMDGFYVGVWDADRDSAAYHSFLVMEDNIRSLAKTGGSNRTIFNDFDIQNIILKRDGSFWLISEYTTTQTNNLQNNYWNRNDFWGYSTNPYYFNDPFYGGFYRPYNPFYNNAPNTRFYSENVVILSVTNNGDMEWARVLSKQQYSDENDQYLSFFNFNTNEGVHFLFNEISKRDKLMLNTVFTADGESKRNPSIKTFERGYEFMPRYSKQVGPRQVIVPASYRGQIVFAKIDF